MALEDVQDFHVLVREIAELLRTEKVEDGQHAALVQHEDAAAIRDAGRQQEFLEEVRAAAALFLDDVRIAIDARALAELIEILEVIFLIVTLDIGCRLALLHADETALVRADRAVCIEQQQVALRIGNQHPQHAHELRRKVADAFLRIEFQEDIVDRHPFCFFQHTVRLSLPSICFYKKTTPEAAGSRRRCRLICNPL